MSVSNRDRVRVRDLAIQYRELCESERNLRNVDLWRALNSLRPERPLVWANLGLLGAEIETVLPPAEVENEELRSLERWLQKMLWSASIHDDRVFYPWFAVRAEMYSLPDSDWGISTNVVRDPSSRGWRNLPVLKSQADLERLRSTPHRVLDANPPIVGLLADVLEDILPVHVDRSTVYRKWGGTDLSEAAGNLFGLEELMYALYDCPDLVHQLMGFMSDAVRENLIEGERAGDFSTVETKNYLVPAHNDSLPDPAPYTYGTQLKQLCFFTHSQEFESVGPEQHEEFLLNYQMPIMQLYGKVAYGCCETLDTKLDLMSKIPNLHKVLAGPLADISLYPEKVGDRCVISWRPNAAPMVCRGFDPENVRAILRKGFEATKGCSVEVHLHEPMTVEGEISRVAEWALIAIGEAERIAGDI